VSSISRMMLQCKLSPPNIQVCFQVIPEWRFGY
jgi:hypothetical protein